MKQRLAIWTIAVLGICVLAAAISIRGGAGGDPAPDPASGGVPRQPLDPPPPANASGDRGGDPGSGAGSRRTFDEQPSQAPPDGGTATRAPKRPVPTVPTKPPIGRSHAIVELRRGARVPLLSRPGGRLLASLDDESEFGSPLVLGVVRVRGSWLGVTTPLRRNGDLGWVRFDADKVRLYWTRYWLRVRLAARKLELRYGGRTLGRYTVTVGAAGTETPRGRFSVTDALDFGASPFYGCCALALSGHQERLPPGWLGGDRVAIHGTPGPVGDAASSGCIRATDATMRTLFRRVPLGTPVFVRG